MFLKGLFQYKRNDAATVRWIKTRIYNDIGKFIFVVYWFFFPVVLIQSALCVCKRLNGQLQYFFPFKGSIIQYLYEITNPFIWKCIFKGWGVGLYNLQLFKALVLVMNYFVISTVMRFIFNNCNNYFIKKRSHALWLSRQGLKLEGILIKSIILPRCAFSWMSRWNYIRCQQCLC